MSGFSLLCVSLCARAQGTTYLQVVVTRQEMARNVLTKARQGKTGSKDDGYTCDEVSNTKCKQKLCL